ncbi:hypothetical protein VE03_07613 [Pseudogymnoascus sp. 23342-1-I1]|nr:hypothetical protein VE03_07613 [Pseudogymnoascus sp. 23342-1-I1]
MADNKEQARERRSQIEKVLLNNWIGPHRSQVCAINEFKHWQVSEVEALFALLPPLNDRKLSPHGPECRPPPRGNQRWKELAMKTAIMGITDLMVVAVSPLIVFSKTARKETVPQLVKLHYDSIGSSFFVSSPMDMLRQAAQTKMAVCVNSWGRFSIRSSGYAAISHVWAETMGLEFQDEKIMQDERGINYSHFSRIISKAAASSSCEWFWLDLLAVPQIVGNEDEATMLRELKTNVVNSLINVYKNADTVIILDALTLQLSSEDPCDVAAILSCGRWLTRMWTYQEIKLARKAQIVTKTGAIDFEQMVCALDARKQQSEEASRHWHEIHLKFARLLPSDPRGVSLADVAFCCSDRNTEKDIDYARSVFAILNLQWNATWDYDAAITHILKSRPQDAARIANLQGRRGLPPPYSWAPRYLARLTGVIIDGFVATENGLVGYWTTFLVQRVIRHGENKTDTKIIFHMELLNRHGKSFELLAGLPYHWSDKIAQWVEQAVPAGTARLLCATVPENLLSDHDPVVMLMVIQGDGEEGSWEGAFGTVVGTAEMDDPNCTELDGEKLEWLLA